MWAGWSLAENNNFPSEDPVELTGHGCSLQELPGRLLQEN